MQNNLLGQKFLIFVILILVTGTCLGQEPGCDDEVLGRLEVRAACQHSPNPKNCGSLAFFEGTEAAAVLATAAATKGEYKQVLKNLNQLRKAILLMRADYKKVLDEYFKIKKLKDPSFNPTTRVLNWEEFSSVSAELKLNPKLRGNSFMREFEAIGFGHANDVYQKIDSIAFGEGSSFFGKVKNGVNFFFSLMGLEKNMMILIGRGVARENGLVASKEDLDIEKQTLKQSRAKHAKMIKSAVKITGGAAVAVASSIATPMETGKLEISVRNCATSLGLRLSEEETYDLMNHLSLNRETDQTDCNSIDVTESGAKAFRFSGGKLNEFACKFEKKFGQRQDELLKSAKVKLNHCGFELGKVSASVDRSKNVISVKTSAGVVDLKTNVHGDWEFSPMSKDPDFDKFLTSKVRGPGNSRINPESNIYKMRPAIACTSFGKGKNPEAFCELSKTMAAYSQLSTVIAMTCGSGGAPSSNMQIDEGQN